MLVYIVIESFDCTIHGVFAQYKDAVDMVESFKCEAGEYQVEEYKVIE